MRKGWHCKGRERKQLMKWYLTSFLQIPGNENMGVDIRITLNITVSFLGAMFVRFTSVPWCILLCVSIHFQLQYSAGSKRKVLKRKPLCVMLHLDSWTKIVPHSNCSLGYSLPTGEFAWQYSFNLSSAQGGCSVLHLAPWSRHRPLSGIAFLNAKCKCYLMKRYFFLRTLQTFLLSLLLLIADCVHLRTRALSSDLVSFKMGCSVCGNSKWAEATEYWNVLWYSMLIIIIWSIKLIYFSQHSVHTRQILWMMLNVE